MQLMINGDTTELPDGATVEAMLEQLGVPSRKVAVERNLEIVPKSGYAEIKLEPGDRIEIVHFIGGG